MNVEKKEKKKYKVNLRRILKAFILYYFAGMIAFPAYMYLTYPKGECLSDECPGKSAMLNSLFSSADFWLTVVPIWPVLIPMDALTRDWNTDSIKLMDIAPTPAN